MSLFRNLGILLFVIFLTGCEDISKREYMDIQYLNYETLNELNNYPNDDIGDSTNDDLVKSTEGKYIRWTATVIEVKSNEKLILKEKELPEIEVDLSNRIEDGKIKKGDIVTVSGSLDKYVHGLFGTTPKWMVEDGAIIETADKEKKELLSYQEALLDKKNQLVEKEKKKKTAKKEEEEKKAKEQNERDKKEKELKAIEVAKQKEYEKTPEGQREIVEKAVVNAIGEKVGDKDILVDVRSEEKNWIIELNSVSSMTKNMTRNGLLSDSQEIFQEVFPLSENFDSILLVWLMEVVDVRGNVEIRPVMKIELTKTNANSIKWDNFDYKNFPVVSNTFWQSEVLE
ncbi:MAG: hypothetical protein WBB47_13050 [Paenisporosarcina sp.]